MRTYILLHVTQVRDYTKHFLQTPKNGKNTQSSLEFLKLNLQNSLFTLANKPRFKVLNVASFYSLLSLEFS